MAPVNPCSLSNASLPSGTAFTTKKINCLSRYSFLGESSKETLFLPKFTLPLSTSVRLFPPYRNRCVLQCKARTHILSALGTNVAVEEPDSQVENKSSESPSVSVEASEESSIKTDVSPAPVQPKRPRPSRKSEMPPVKNEELVPGTSFTGKVRSIQPFGAFIDFGAFTDGLVHISRLSNTYVKDIASFISVGQEVKVWLVEANTETGRISLTMRDNDDISKKDAPGSSDKLRPARKNTYPKKDEVRKTSKFVKGQDLQGTVKNLTRSGAFISLPEGEEGFLPQSEESNEAFVNVMGGSSLRVGQEISAQVLRITRGNVTLTMKKKEDIEELNSKLNQGVVHIATNPFVLAFRSNKDIAAFLDERKEVANSAETKEMSKVSEEIDGKVEQIATNSTILDMQDQSMGTGEELVEETSLGGTNTVYDASSESVKNNEESDGLVSNLAKTVDAVQTIQEKVEASAEALASEDIIPSADEVIAKASEISSVETDVEPKLSGERADGILSSEGMVSKEDIGGQAEDASANDKVQIQTSLAENEFTATLAVDAEKVKTVPEKNGSIGSSNGQIDISMSKGKLENNEKEDPSGNLPDDQLLSSESQVSVGSVENQVNDTIAEDEVQIQSPLSENNISSTPTEVEKAAVVPEGNSSEQPDVPSPQESSTRVIAPALVKQLREETGAGMMDCKKALSETGGGIVKAQEFLRKKGLASADKKASRATAEGRIGSYIHYSRIGVLIEVNCETDFVSRGDIFKELVDDLAMQVAACPQVQHLVTEDVPEELINKEREIEMQKEDLLLKPEQIRSKIVEGRIRKRLEELALLEQPYIKNDKVLVKDWLKQTIATIGENIKVKRFVRYNLGEGLQKKSQDFAAEVAAQTAAQPASAPAKEQPVTDATEETVQKSPAVTVSAALVKQLREETGAGMMDCKKALSETGGDLEKAQAYLRKKGLSTADKKSNRIAAEGRIGSYIHDSRIGVLIEVNCETDFVGRSEQFQELVDDLAMQVVACPPVQFVSVEDIPDSIVRKEKEVEMQREDLLTKPENIRERIVEGRVSKRLGELALLEQPFIKNDSILVKDLVKQTVATLGENVKIRRFVRFTLGETVETAKTSTES